MSAFSPTPGQTYQIRFTNGFYLALTGFGVVSPVGVQTGGALGNPAQSFLFIQVAPGQWAIVSYLTGQAVYYAGNNTWAATQYAGTANQQFQVRNDNGSNFQFYVADSAEYLTGVPVQLVLDSFSPAPYPATCGTYTPLPAPPFPAHDADSMSSQSPYPPKGFDPNNFADKPGVLASETILPFFLVNDFLTGNVPPIQLQVQNSPYYKLRKTQTWEIIKVVEPSPGGAGSTSVTVLTGASKTVATSVTKTISSSVSTTQTELDEFGSGTSTNATLTSTLSQTNSTSLTNYTQTSQTETLTEPGGVYTVVWQQVDHFTVSRAPYTEADIVNSAGTVWDIPTDKVVCTWFPQSAPAPKIG